MENPVPDTEITAKTDDDFREAMRNRNRKRPTEVVAGEEGTPLVMDEATKKAILESVAQKKEAKKKILDQVKRPEKLFKPYTGPTPLDSPPHRELPDGQSLWTGVDVDH